MSAQEFSQERLMKILLAPQISEKATYVAENNEQVIFRVSPDATKPEIKAAVEMMFSKAVGPLRKEVEKLTGKSAELLPHSISPY